MRVRALYVGKTYSYKSHEPCEYAILNERDIETVDVAMLSKEPPEGVVMFPDLARGFTARPDWEVREYLLIISGVLRRAIGTAIMKLEDVRVEKKIDPNVVVKEVLNRIDAISKVADSNQPIKPEEAVVTVDNLEFSIVQFKPAASSNAVEETIKTLYRMVSVARRRVLIASPAFVEIIYGSQPKWYVVPLPVAFTFMRDNPDALVTAGIIDRNGFKAPFFVVRNMTPEDLGTVDTHQAAVDYINSIISSQGARESAMIQLGGMFAGATPTAPF